MITSIFLFCLPLLLCVYISISLSNFFWKNSFRKLAKEKDLSVFVVGAGLSGVGIALILEELNIKYHIVEKRSEVGGTWFDNQYPGVGCDVQSHLYSFSPLTNPDWSQSYSEGPEILEYVKRIAAPIRSKIQFNTAVVNAVWKEELSKWEVHLDSGSRVYVDVMVTGVGLLHKPRYPSFTGTAEFRGTTFHTNTWNKNCELKGKRVGIIGTGATAVQAIPKIAEMGLEKLVVFQRSPSWIPNRGNYRYWGWVKTLFRYCPPVQTLYRWFIFLRLELVFFLIFILPSSTSPILGRLHSLVQRLTHWSVTRHTMRTVKDPETARKLLPDFPMGCKRITPSDSYLQAFNRENVFLETTKIERFEETGIRTADGTLHEFDVVIYATGFDLIGSVNAFPVEGRGGADLATDHGDAPRAMFGITHHLAPNYFMMGGPGIVIGHNSVIFIGECQLTYIMGGIRELLQRGARTVCLKEQAMLAYQEWSQNKMKNKVFEGVRFCSSWYRNEAGVNWTFWPTHLISFWWNTRKFDSHNYDFTFE